MSLLIGIHLTSQTLWVDTVIWGTLLGILRPGNSGIVAHTPPCIEPKTGLTIQLRCGWNFALMGTLT